MRKAYQDGPFGQVHYRITETNTSPTQPDLYCLHPAPFSGVAYLGLVPHLSAGRRVIAPDYPGYGGSDAHTLMPSVDEYADAMMAVIDAVSGPAPVDLLGFHTGCLVGAELARRMPERVRKLCLIDAPAFPPERSAELAEGFKAPVGLSGDINCLERAWSMGITSRLESQPMDRAFEMFSETIRPGKAMNAAFYAAFTYPWAERLPEVKTDTHVIATQSQLLDGSRLVAEIIEGASLQERLDVKRSVLDEAAETIGADINNYLTGTSP